MLYTTDGNGSMSEASQNKGVLLLPDLTIRGFRGIDDLSISRLGRVTLVAGKNGSGKTTLLEAVQVYAARGQYSVLNGLLLSREEFLEETDEEGITSSKTDWDALFHGRCISDDTRISIGPDDPTRQVRIQVFARPTVLSSSPDLLDDELMWVKVECQNRSIEFPMVSPSLQWSTRRPSPRSWGEVDFPTAVDCNYLGPDLSDNAKVARFWHSVALTDDEDFAVAALRLITNERIERVAVVGQGNRGTRLNQGRRVMLRIAGERTPVPLKSLGDGATRFFGIALALANSRNGFLIIDEVENGIHHSMQRALWKMVLQTALKNDVQVFAATHSWDCVRGFAQAVTELEDVDGVLVRLERHGDNTRAVEYSEEELRVAAEQGIEVR